MMASKGIAFEHEIAKLFRKNGYDVVRGAASKGRPFGIDADLIASKRTAQNDKIAVLVVIQCKVKGVSHGRGGKRAGAGRKPKVADAAQNGLGNQIESNRATNPHQSDSGSGAVSVFA